MHLLGDELRRRRALASEDGDSGEGADLALVKYGIGNEAHAELECRRICARGASGAVHCARRRRVRRGTFAT